LTPPLRLSSLDDLPMILYLGDIKKKGTNGSRQGEEREKGSTSHMVTPKCKKFGLAQTISGDHFVTGKISCDKFSYPTSNFSPYETVVFDDGNSRFL
jgi:hypothetical protein